MVDLQRLHLRCPPRLTAALHHCGHLVVHPHERQRTRGLAAAGQLFTLASQGRKIRSRAGTKLEEHGLAAGEVHDVLHVVLHALNEAGAPLRVFVGVVRHHHVALGMVPAPVARRSLDAVLVVEADVEPDRRVERTVLVDAEPREVAVEVLAVLLRLEVAVGDPPIGNRAGDAVDELLDGVFPLGGVDLAVEVLAHHHVGGQLAPGCRNLAGRLLKKHLTVFALDSRRPQLPLRGVERAFCLNRAEGGLDFDRGSACGLATPTDACGSGLVAGQRGGRVESCHGGTPDGDGKRKKTRN